MKFWPLTKKSIETIPDDDEAILAAFTGPTPGAAVTAKSALTVPAVAAAVRIISEAAATLDIHLVKRADGVERVAGHPSLELLRGDVNNWTSGYELIRDMVAESLLHDSGALAWVNRVDGKVVEIVHYERGTIQVQYEETREPTYRLSGVPVPASDIIHLRGPFERCPIMLAREAIGAAMVMEAHASRLFRNGARPGGVIELAKNLGDPAWKRLKAGWRAAHEGIDNAGKTAILPDGATFKPIQLNSTDAEFLLNRRFQLEEVARAFGIPVQMLGDLTKSSYANAEQKQLEFLAYCLDPHLCASEAALNRALLNDDERAELTFRFDRDDLSRASLTQRSNAIASLRASKVLTANEGRGWIGLPPIGPEGDVFENTNITAHQIPTEPTSQVPHE